MNKRQVLGELKRRGYSRAVVSFSGGNDEGGADGVAFYDEDGDPVPGDRAPKETYVETVWNERYRQYVPKEAVDPKVEADNKLIGALEEPIFDRYGSFAGDFYVSGELVWDVAAGTCAMDGSEEVPRSEPFHHDL